jgi:hypothetical protein
VEPRRTISLIKFSGTLQHPPRNDKMGKTITAFAHFVYVVSKKSLVFADIQGLWYIHLGLSILMWCIPGSPMNVNDRDGVVLFDLQTHTSDGWECLCQVSIFYVLWYLPYFT